MRKKLFLFILPLLTFSLMTEAEHALVVQLADGSTQSYVLTAKPEITMIGSLLKITSPDVSSEYKLTSVTDFHFTEVLPTKINKVTRNELRFVRQNSDIIQIVGDSGNISVYNSGGQTQSVSVFVNGNEKDVNLSSLPKGIYIDRKSVV